LMKESALAASFALPFAPIVQLALMKRRMYARLMRLYVRGVVPALVPASVMR